MGKKWRKKKKKMMMMMMMMIMIRPTLGVSIILCNHWALHPDTVWSSSHLHRAAYQSDAADCSEQTSSFLVTDSD